MSSALTRYSFPMPSPDASTIGKQVLTLHERTMPVEMLRALVVKMIDSFVQLHEAESSRFSTKIALRKESERQNQQAIVCLNICREHDLFARRQDAASDAYKMATEKRKQLSNEAALHNHVKQVLLNYIKSRYGSEGENQ